MIVLPSSPKLTVLKASAGSGKTYSLAREYIALAIMGDFRQILAVTFTNKATREMKERIVVFLKKLAAGKDPSLHDQLCVSTGLSPEEIGRRASLVLKRILHQYSHFSVSTIDSFNQKILRSFTREIGLIGNFNLELDTQKIVETGVDLVLDSGAEKKEIKKWLLDFIKDKLQQGKSWDIKKDLRSLAMELYSEPFRIVESELSYQFPEAGKLKEYVNSLKAIKHVFENQMKSFGRQAEEISTRYGLTVTDFKYGKSGVFNYFLKIQQPSADYMPGSRVMECHNNPDNWFTKTSVKRADIGQAIAGGLQDTLASTLLFYDKKYTEYVTADAILRNLYTLGLLSEIKNAIDSHKRDHDLFLLTDTNAFLKSIIGENDAPFIYEKSGSWYSHFLIDEFQDTSRLQWANFKPLVSNALAEDRQNLIVGDAKQSIYRWRGGDWELIEKDLLNDFAGGSLQTQNLDVNWRSSPQVVAFNNALFKILPGVFRNAFESMNTSGDGAFEGDFNLIYSNAEQHVSDSNRGNAGYIKASFSAKEETKKEWKALALDWLKANIDRLLALGYSPGSLAILTRTKSEGTEVVDFLHEQKSLSPYPFEIISNESLLLMNFPATRLIINCLKYIKDPESTLALANVAVEYIYTRGPEAALNDVLSKVTFKEDVASLFPQDFIDNIETFRRHSLLEAIAKIITIFNLHKNPENTVCLTAMQDIALDFVKDNSNSVKAFLDWWDEEGSRQTLKSPENTEAIQVMTIHKSKGLEFDVVLVPFMNWDTDHNNTSDVYLWCKNEKDPFTEMPVVPLRYQSKLAGSFFAGEYFNEKHKAFIDSLNLCYVALTRAKKALFLHGELPKQKSSKKSFCASDLIFEALTHEQFELKNHFREEEQFFEYGTLEKPVNAPARVKPTPKPFIQNTWSGKAELKRRGRDLFKKEQQSRRQKINFGLIVHEILAELKDFSDLDSLVARYCAQGEITRDESAILKEQLDKIFANPEVAKWFETGWDVKTERAILSKDSGELRPDRVMIKDRYAIIVDFKTGKEDPKHAKQLIRYRNQLFAMGYQSVSAFLLYISANKVKQIA